MQSAVKGQLPEVWSVFSLQLFLVSVDSLKPRQLMPRDIYHNLLCRDRYRFGLQNFSGIYRCTYLLPLAGNYPSQ